MKLSERLELGTSVFADLKPHEAAAVSQAISMKRIADSLEKLTADHGILSENYFWQLGDSFGQGLQVGQRR